MNTKFVLRNLIDRESLYRILRIPLFNLAYRKYVRAHYINEEFPRCVGVEVTDICNRNCLICPSSKVDKIGNIDLAIVKKIAQESAAWGHKGMEFSLHKMGEPFLNKDIWKIVKIIKSINKDSVISFVTNGLLLKDNVQLIVDYKVDLVKVSVSSVYLQPGKKSENEIKEIEEGVERLLSKRRNNVPHIIVQLVETQRTKDEVNAFKKRWSKYPIVINISFEENWNGAFDEVFLSPKFDYAQKRYPCFYLWLSPQINADGTVSACPTDWNKSLLIGDLKRNSMAEIWQGKAISDLRARHLKRDYRGCEKCNSWLLMPNFF